MKARPKTKSARYQRVMLAELDRCIDRELPKWKDEANWNENFKTLFHNHNLKEGSKDGPSMLLRNFEALVNHPRDSNTPASAKELVAKGSSYVSKKWKCHIGWHQQHSERNSKACSIPPLKAARVRSSGSDSTLSPAPSDLLADDKSNDSDTTEEAASGRSSESNAEIIIKYGRIQRQPTAEWPYLDRALSQSLRETQVPRPLRRPRSSMTQVTQSAETQRIPKSCIDSQSATSTRPKSDLNQQAHTAPAPGSSAVMHTTRLFVNTTNVVVDHRQLARDMLALYGGIKSVAVDLLHHVDCATSSQLQSCAHLVLESDINRWPQLNLLYCQLFGGYGLSASRAHHVSNTSTLYCVVGLISAFVYKNIFEHCPQLKQPNDILESVQTAFGSQAISDHFSRELLEMGTSLDAMLRRARMNGINASEEPELGPLSTTLVADLAPSLLAHLSCQRGASMDGSWQEFQTRWSRALKDIFTQALMIKVKMVSSSETFHAIWMKPDTPFDHTMMETITDQAEQALMIYSTIFPGLGKVGHPGLLCKALVNAGA